MIKKPVILEYYYSTGVLAGCSGDDDGDFDNDDDGDGVRGEIMFIT